jgi:hypothetical protein
MVAMLSSESKRRNVEIIPVNKPNWINVDRLGWNAGAAFPIVVIM